MQGWVWRRTRAFAGLVFARLVPALIGIIARAATGRVGRITVCAAVLAPALAAAQGMEASRHRLTIAGETRSYLMVAPQGMAQPAPVVIALHGAMQTPQSFRAYFGLDAAAQANGFVAVYPEGEGRVWNDGRPAAMRLKMVLRPGDDVVFLAALTRKLVAEGIADPARIYLVGISNGGFMVERMACEHAGMFAAYAVIMATMPANYREECRPSRPVPIMFIHGTADTVITYDGFWTPVGATLSAPDSAALFAGLNGCGPAQRRALPDLDPGDGTSITERRYDGCRDDAVVRLLSVERGGHQSPARVDTTPDLATPFLGLRSRDIDAGEEVWRFFSGHALPAAVPAGADAAAVPPLPRPSPLRAGRPDGRANGTEAARLPGAQRGINTQ